MVLSDLLFPAAFRARIRLFRFARGTTLIEIAVYNNTIETEIPEIFVLVIVWGQYGFECNLGKTCTSEFFKDDQNLKSLKNRSQ